MRSVSEVQSYRARLVYHIQRSKRDIEEAEHKISAIDYILSGDD